MQSFIPTHTTLLRKALSVLPLFFSLLLLGSCDSASENPYEVPPEEDNYFFSLKLQSLSNETRGDSDGFENDGCDDTIEGSKIENYIDIVGHDFHIALFDSEGNFIQEFDEKDISINNYNPSVPQEILVTINKKNLEISAQDFFYVVVLANWKAFGQTSYDSLASKNLKAEETNSIWSQSEFYNFSYPVDSESKTSWVPELSQGSRQLIPMFGMGPLEVSKIKSDSNNIDGSVIVHMLRSLAKITIEVSEELFNNMGFDIGECEINKYVEKGRLIPDLSKGWDTFDSQTGIHVSKPSTDGFIIGDTPLSFKNIASDGSKTVLAAYLPEMRSSSYTTNSDDRPYLTVSLLLKKESYKKPKRIELSKYIKTDPQGNNLFDLLRNHHYRYEVNEITEGGEISVSYTVCPWGKGSTDIEFK